MKPKTLHPLRKTPRSSPLLHARHVDSFGEPTHPKVVRDPNDYAPWGTCPEDTESEVWAYAGEGKLAYTFWYWFSDGEERGIHVRASSYVEAARLARFICQGLCARRMVRLQAVEIHDMLEG